MVNGKWWQHAVSKWGTLLLSQEGCCLEAEGKAAHAAIRVFLTYLDSMMAICCPHSGTLSSSVL